MKTWLVQLATQALIRVFLKTSVIRWGTIEVFYVYKLFFFLHRISKRSAYESQDIIKLIIFTAP